MIITQAYAIENKTSTLIKMRLGYIILIFFIFTFLTNCEDKKDNSSSSAAGAKAVLDSSNTSSNSSSSSSTSSDPVSKDIVGSYSFLSLTRPTESRYEVGVSVGNSGCPSGYSNPKCRYEVNTYCKQSYVDTWFQDVSLPNSTSGSFTISFSSASCSSWSDWSLTSGSYRRCFCNKN